MSAWKQKANNSSGGDGNFDAPEAGTKRAVLVALIQLGTQKSNLDDKWLPKVFMVWELPDDPKPGGGGNFFVGRDYTLSFGQKSALRAVVEKWRGGKAFTDNEEFDLTVLLGKPCLLSLVHKISGKGRTYAKIDGVAQLPKQVKGQPVQPPPKATVKPILWAIDSDEPYPDAEWLPYVYGEPLADVINRSRERSGVAAPGAGDAAEDEDLEPIPF